jgi:hypothetical protein
MLLRLTPGRPLLTWHLLSHATARPRQAGTSFESQTHNPGRQADQEPGPPGPLNATNPAHCHPGQTRNAYAQSGGSARGSHCGLATFRCRWLCPLCRDSSPSGLSALRDRLPGRQPECFRVGPSVVAGQHLAKGAWPVGDGALAEPAARDRQTGHGHREAAGARITHRLHDASRTKATSPAPPARSAATGVGSFFR